MGLKIDAILDKVDIIDSNLSGELISITVDHLNLTNVIIDCNIMDIKTNKITIDNLSLITNKKSMSLKMKAEGLIIINNVKINGLILNNDKNPIIDIDAPKAQINNI